MGRSRVRTVCVSWMTVMSITCAFINIRATFAISLITILTNAVIPSICILTLSVLAAFVAAISALINVHTDMLIVNSD